MIGATLPQVTAWIGGTIVGVLGGDLIGDPERLGLDVIFPAFFLILLAEELRSASRSARAVIVALIAAVLALALVPFAPPGVPVIAACAAALLSLRRSS
jgi:predicted branched-subunit amino acid permease